MLIYSVAATNFDKDTTHAVGHIRHVTRADDPEINCRGSHAFDAACRAANESTRNQAHLSASGQSTIQVSFQ
jgi:hypothetical protein